MGMDGGREAGDALAILYVLTMALPSDGNSDPDVHDRVFGGGRGSV